MLGNDLTSDAREHSVERFFYLDSHYSASFHTRRDDRKKPIDALLSLPPSLRKLLRPLWYCTSRVGQRRLHVPEPRRARYKRVPLFPKRTLAPVLDAEPECR